MATFTATDNSSFLSVYGEYTFVDDQANNQSTVTVSIHAVKISGQTATTGNSTLSITIDGQTFTDSGNKTVPTGPSDTIMFSASKVITHTANGSKTINVSIAGGLSGSSWTSSSGSASVTLTDFIFAPSAPSAKPTVTRSSNGTSITITSAAATPDNNGSISDYRVQRSLDGSSWYSITGTLNANTSMGVDAVYTWATANATTPYYFRTFARDISAPTAYEYGPVSATSDIIGGIPGVPGAISVTKNTSFPKRRDLSWTAAANNSSAITSYIIEARYSSDGGTTWDTAYTLLGTSSGTGTTYTTPDLTVAKTYQFRIAAVNGIGTGAYVESTTPHTFISAYGYRYDGTNFATAIQTAKRWDATLSDWVIIQNVKRWDPAANSGAGGWIDLIQ